MVSLFTCLAERRNPLTAKSTGSEGRAQEIGSPVLEAVYQVLLTACKLLPLRTNPNSLLPFGPPNEVYSGGVLTRVENPGSRLPFAGRSLNGIYQEYYPNYHEHWMLPNVGKRGNYAQKKAK